MRSGPWYGAHLRPSGLRVCVACAAILLVLAFAACNGASAHGSAATPTATTPTAPTRAATPQPTVAAGPPLAHVANLTTFRQKVAIAFETNTWSNVAPLISPDFSFQGINSGGASLVMPDSETDVRRLYTNGGPWTQSAQWEVSVHSCYAWGTPTSQQMGFDGGSGNFILIGIVPWKGGWLIGWAFQDPLGGSDGCASG